MNSAKDLMSLRNPHMHSGWHQIPSSLDKDAGRRYFNFLITPINWIYNKQKKVMHSFQIQMHEHEEIKLLELYYCPILCTIHSLSNLCPVIGGYCCHSAMPQRKVLFRMKHLFRCQDEHWIYMLLVYTQYPNSMSLPDFPRFNYRHCFPY